MENPSMLLSLPVGWIDVSFLFWLKVVSIHPTNSRAVLLRIFGSIGILTHSLPFPYPWTFLNVRVV